VDGILAVACLLNFILLQALRQQMREFNAAQIEFNQLQQRLNENLHERLEMHTEEIAKKRDKKLLL
jgi:hypothetical protein